MGRVSGSFWKPVARSCFAHPDADASARTYLAVDEIGVLVGYLALCAREGQLAQADERIRRGMPRHPIPAVLLARLAVARERQGQGVGRELVWHAAALTLSLDPPTDSGIGGFGRLRPASAV